MLSMGRAQGPFQGCRGLKLERDHTLPIRCTVQFYGVTDSRDVTQGQVDTIAARIAKVYERATAVGSLVVRPDRSRQTAPQRVAVGPVAPGEVEDGRLYCDTCGVSLFGGSVPGATTPSIPLSRLAAGEARDAARQVGDAPGQGRVYGFCSLRRGLRDLVMAPGSGVTALPIVDNRTGSAPLRLHTSNPYSSSGVSDWHCDGCRARRPLPVWNSSSSPSSGRDLCLSCRPLTSLCCAACVRRHSRTGVPPAPTPDSFDPFAPAPTAATGGAGGLDDPFAPQVPSAPARAGGGSVGGIGGGHTPLAVAVRLADRDSDAAVLLGPGRARPAVGGGGSGPAAGPPVAPFVGPGPAAPVAQGGQHGAPMLR